MKYILGIDQGASNTRAAVIDLSGTILGFGKTHGTYFPRDTMPVSLGVISKAVDEALSTANLKIDDINMIVVGIAGIDYEGDDVYVTESFRKFFGVYDVYAYNDCVIAYFGGTIEAVGAVICAGTGINVAYFTPDGRINVLSDYLKFSLQGGSAISRRAIEAVFESKIGVWSDTKLEQLFLDAAEANSTHDVLKMYVSDSNFIVKITSLTKQILEIAADGDQVAQMVLQDFSDELCACFLGAMKQENMIDLSCDIVLAGSVYKGVDNYLRRATTKTLMERIPNTNIINANFEPVVGACIMGLNKMVGSFDETMRQNTVLSAKKFEIDRV